jgi:peptidoglycan-associated lipoprotein
VHHRGGAVGDGAAPPARPRATASPLQQGVAMRTSPSLVLSALAAMAIAGAGCGGKKQVTATTSTMPNPGSQRVAAEPKRSTGGADVASKHGAAMPDVGRIYFDYDKATLRPEARDTLDRLAAWLRATPGAAVTIAGHADERGTEEYNLALGDQRAKVARDYLVRLGIDGDRVETISYGEERPAVSGSSEDAWQQNRRGELAPRVAGR